MRLAFLSVMLVVALVLQTQADEEYHQKTNELTLRMILFQFATIIFVAVIVLILALAVSATRR